MAGRSIAGRGLGSYGVDRRFDGDARPPFDEPPNPRAWPGGGGGRSGFSRAGRGPPVCFNCQKPGHMRSACPSAPTGGRFSGPAAERGSMLRDARELEYGDRDSGFPQQGRLNGTTLGGPPERWHRPGDEYAGAHFNPPGAGPPRGGGGRGGCYTCGQSGHFARECPSRREPAGPPGRRNEEEDWRSPPRKAGVNGVARKVWLYEDLEGKLRGPYDLEQLQKWLQSGHFEVDQIVCAEGSVQRTTLGRVLGLPPRQDPGPQSRPPNAPSMQREDPPFHAADKPPPPRKSRFDSWSSQVPAEPSGCPPPGFSPAAPMLPIKSAQLPRLHIPDGPSPPVPGPPLSSTPPPADTPSVAATPSIVSSISPSPATSVSPHPHGFAFPTPPAAQSPATHGRPSQASQPSENPGKEHQPAVSVLQNGQAWGNAVAVLEKETPTPHIQWENGYDGTSDLSGSEPGSPMHMSPRAALGQQLLDQLDSPKQEISRRVERILRDAELGDEAPVEQRMDVVIGILGRRLLDREGKEEKEMRSFVYGSHAEVEPEVPIVSAWKHGYGFGEMVAAEARESSAAPSNEFNLDPDLFYHAYGPGNSGKGGQQFYHDEEAALGEPDHEGGAPVYELDREREKQDPAKWLLRGGDWKLENDPQLKLDDETVNPPPLCKYVLNRGLPLCGEEAPEVDPELGEGPKDPRLGGSFRAAMQEAVRADFAKLEVPAFGQGGIPATLLKAAEKARASRPVTASPSPSITSPTENVRPPVPARKIPKKPGAVVKKAGVLKKTPSTPGLAKSEAATPSPSGAGSETPVLARLKVEAGEQKAGGRSESPAARALANGLPRKSSQLASTPKDSPKDTPRKARASKWDEGKPGMKPAERPPKKMSLAEAVEAAKREASKLGPEEGQWFYLDGQGLPRGPHSLPQLRVMASQGKIMEGISAWRMADDTWTPITKQPLTRTPPRFPLPSGPFTPGPPPPGYAGPWPRAPSLGMPAWQPPRRGVPFQPPLPPGLPPGGSVTPSRSRCEEPAKVGKADERSVPAQLVAMVRGKLHEQVVKTARTKVLDAAIDAALGAWLQAKLGGPLAPEPTEPEAPRRRVGEVETAGEDLTDSASAAVPSEGGTEQAEAAPPQEERPASADAAGPREPFANEAEDPEALRSLEKFLKSRRSIAYIFLDACKSARGGMDMALLARYACVCKGFRKGAELAKLRMFKADFSGLAERCSDAALKSLETCGEGLVKFVYLNGCVNVTPEAVEDLLRAQPSIRCVDIQGCVQLYSLARSTAHIKWRNLPEALLEVPGGANALPPELLEDQQKRREKFAKARQLRGIERILDEIRKLDEAKIFLVPVSEEQYPNYSKVIQRPIALVTMRQRLKGRYLPLGKGVDRFREDMDLMFDNAKRFNREGTFYYKEAVRLQKVADKLLDHLEARVQGTLDGTVPVRKVSDRRGERPPPLPKPAELDLAVQTRPVKPVKTPRGVADAEALPSISASSVEESYRAGMEEGAREGEPLKKRKEREEEREEPESSKRPREDSDAESNRARGKRPREDEESEDYRGLERRRTDSAKRLEAEGKRPVSAPLQWERDQKGKRTGIKVPRVDSRGVWSQALVETEPIRRAAAQRARQRWRDEESESEAEEWESESTDEEQDVEAEEESEAESEVGESDAEDALSDEEPEDHTAWVMEDDLADRTNWGAKMTKATMVPPVSRKYELIDEYRIVSDEAMVRDKMRAQFPDFILNKLTLRAETGHTAEIIVHPRKARKILGEEVLEQEVYGIDPYTHNLLLATMCSLPKVKAPKVIVSDEERRTFIEQPLLMALNRAAAAYTGYTKVPESLDLKVIVQVVAKEAHEAQNQPLKEYALALLEAMEKRPLDKYLAYRKGLGVVCNRTGICKDDFVVEFHGEVYPPYRWFEKEDEIRRLQKKEVAPEFYNIMLERPKKDLGGYDLLVIDAMHKANFASRLCHSCTPNCATKVTAVDGHYMIGLYAIEDIQPGEELTFNYHSVTESKEEHEHAVCLCGSRQCQGSYLNFAGSTSFQQVMNKSHGVLNRHHLLLAACQDPTLTSTDIEDLEKAGFKSSLLDGLPPWAVKYAAQVAHFIFYERKALPGELLAHNKRHKRRRGGDSDPEKQAAQDEAEGVESQRLQNLAITLDKVRHCLTALCGCPATEAPAPLRLLSPGEVVQRLWTADDSLVQQIRRYLELHVDDMGRLAPILEELHVQRPQETEEGLSAMRASLLWLRDALIALDIKPTARHDAAADLLTMYAATKDFFTHADYVASSFESEPVTIVAMDLGVKESSFPPKTVRKAYKPYFVWGQLINWYKQSVADPGATLNNVRRGCLTLPDPGSCYSATAKQAIPRGYGRKQRARMLDKYITNKVQGPWPKQEQHWLWSHNIRGLYGTPWFDAIRAGRAVDSDLVHWLRTRPVFEGPYDHGH